MRLRPWFILSVVEGLSHLDSINHFSRTAWLDIKNNGSFVLKRHERRFIEAQAVKKMLRAQIVRDSFFNSLQQRENKRRSFNRENKMIQNNKTLYFQGLQSNNRAATHQLSAALCSICASFYLHFCADKNLNIRIPLNKQIKTVIHSSIIPNNYINHFTIQKTVPTSM